MKDVKFKELDCFNRSKRRRYFFCGDCAKVRFYGIRFGCFYETFISWAYAK